MSNFINLIGSTFGRLTVIDRAEDRTYKNGRTERRWICKCSCEKQSIITVFESNLKRKDRPTHSCGCLSKEATYKINKKYNIYDLTGEYGIGYTSNTNNPFYFDLEDYNKIKDYCWREDNKGYIITSAIIDGNEVIMFFHKLVMNVENGVIIDHIKHKKYDNRKNELRIVTLSQNSMNRELSKLNTSGVAGVNWNKEKKKWIARITTDCKRLYLGAFNTFDDAVKARKEAEEKYFGEFSYDNSMKVSI